MKCKFFFYLLLCIYVLSACYQSPAYKNTSLTAEERAEDLLSRLTLEEKITLMMNKSPQIERLGIRSYDWWNEALHGVARNGLATVFPQPIGMAATFDPESVRKTFEKVSDEARAKYTFVVKNNNLERYRGLTMWTPNVNIFRDPRWGRGMETYGEDPYLTSVLGLNVVKGLQCLNKGEKYDKLHACAKHFAVHSGPEWNRHVFNAENIALRDLYETYLHAFKILVQKGKVKEVMCAYNRLDGKPCCGNSNLLTQILRNEWGYKGLVVSDCWAIADFYQSKAHHVYPDSTTAVAAAVLSGTDLECGESYQALITSVKQGLVNEKDIDVSVKRILKARFELGEMDNIDSVSWSNIPYSVVASEEHNRIALEMARKSMTLLLNKDNILPLSKTNYPIAIMGPNANDSIMQWGNYNGEPARTVTILEGIQQKLGNIEKIKFIPGCSWVENTLLHSVWGKCSYNGKKGFRVRYWNNREFINNPTIERMEVNPLNLCTKGATVFTPGINLKNFSAIYETSFRPQKSGDLFFSFIPVGKVELYVNGQKVVKFQNIRFGKYFENKLYVEKGKVYNIELKFNDIIDEAQLIFDLGYKDEINLDKTISMIKDIETVIFVGGISPRLEGEQMGVNLPGFKDGDRTDIELPLVQRRMLAALKAAGKKVVLVNCSGSAIGLVPETKSCDAILQAWYPGQAGGIAVADVLFGDYNPAGRLPVTFYKNVKQLPDFLDYNMDNRTYRYFKGEALFPFGYGLSYTSFKYHDVVLPKTIKNGDDFMIKFSLTNIGKYDGDEIVQVYLRKKGDNNGPLKTLRSFKRVHVQKGKTLDISINLKSEQLQWWDDINHCMSNLKGTYEIMIGPNSRDLYKEKFEIL